jgi:eukaryotic-like serine/threonine-protein kinase
MAEESVATEISGAHVAPEPMIEAGTAVGPYRILSHIGRGGMGQVYLARHELLERKVALKVLHRALSTDHDVVQRFFDEARTVNRIRHEHIIEVTDFLETADGVACYVMELLDGLTLRQLLNQLKQLPYPRACRIAAQTASAVAAAHEAGVVHRDLKPENIFLVSRGGDIDYVKLLDFGIAKLTSGDDGAMMGTPTYMAPEQLRGQPADHRVDTYAFGVLLYEMIAGVRPYPGRAAVELLVQQSGGAPPALRQVPGALDALVRSCLSIEPEARPAQMRSVARRLEEIARPKARMGLIGALAAVAAIAAVGVFATREPVEPVVIVTPDVPVVVDKPPLPAEVRIQFESTPPGAQVRRAGDEVVLGTTPFSAVLARSDTAARFGFTLADGGETALDVSLAADGTVGVQFPPRAIGKRSPPPDGPAHPADAGQNTPAPRRIGNDQNRRVIIVDPFAEGG